jgi:DNA polymerase-1
VDLEMRSKAKAVNFGLMYGMGPHRLAADTGITVLEAQAFIDAYFRSFPGIKIHLERCLEEARETGLVRTLLGRQRPIPEIHSSDGRVRSNAENMAVNTPIQGSAADLIKKAMIRLDRRLAQERVGARMILQVHDELVLDVPEAEVDRVTTAVKEEMEGAFELSVPIVVDVATGKNWYEAHA